MQRFINLGALSISDLAGLVTPAEGSDPDSLVEDGLATVLDGRGGLEEEQGSQLLLGQGLNGGGSQLTDIPLATVLLVHSGDGVEEELLSNGELVNSSPLSSPGGSSGKTSKSSSGSNNTEDTTKPGKGGSSYRETGDGSSSSSTGGGGGATQGEDREGEPGPDGASGNEGEHRRDLKDKELFIMLLEKKRFKRT